MIYSAELLTARDQSRYRVRDIQTVRKMMKIILLCGEISSSKVQILAVLSNIILVSF